MRTVARLGAGLLTLHLSEADRSTLACFSVGVMGSSVPEALVRTLRTCPAAELLEVAGRAGLRAWRNAEPQGLAYAPDEGSGGGDVAA